MICPICNEEYQLTDSFCPNCGYEIHILPGNISDAAREYEETREKSFRKTWVALNESHADSQRLEAENSIIQQKFDEKEQELKDIVAQNEKLDNQLKALQEERDQLLSQISERKSTIQKLKDQISDYLDQRAQLKKEKEEWKTKSDKWESKFNELSTKMSEAQYTIEQQKSQIQNTKKALDEANRKKIVETVKRPMAFLLLKGIGEETVGAVYQGNNSYGCMFGGINDPNHQELSIDGLKPFHFRIETVGNRFLLHDAVGNITSANGELIGSKGQILINDTRFSIGKTLKVTFIIIS